MTYYLKLFSSYAKLLLRKRIWFFFCGFLSLLAIYLFSFVYYKGSRELSMHMTAYVQLLLSLVFILMGIQLGKEERSNSFYEVAVCCAKGRLPIAICKILVLAIASLIITFTIGLGIYIAALRQTPVLFTKQSIEYLCLLYTLPMLSYSCIGLLLSHIKQSSYLYAATVLCWLLTSSLAPELTEDLTVLWNSSGNSITNAMNLGVTGLRNGSGLMMNQPIDLPRFIMRVVILIDLILILFTVESGYDHTIKRVICINLSIVFSLTSFSLCLHQHSDFFARFANPDDRINYSMEKYRAYEMGSSVSLNDFDQEKRVTVLSTDIDLYTGTKGLTAAVVMNVCTEAETDHQVFTLYSDFNVDSISIDGAEVDFLRSNDAVMVSFPKTQSKGDRISIRFEYHGFSLPIYPANETSVQLPSRFPWIPFPGLKNAIQYENFYGYETTEAFFVEKWQCDETEYTLHFSGIDGIYTNLDGINADTYSGISKEGVSLFSGMISVTEENLTVYAPASQYKFLNSIKETVPSLYDDFSDLCEMLDTPIKPVIPDTIAYLGLDAPIIVCLPQMTTSSIRTNDSSWEIWYGNGAGMLLRGGPEASLTEAVAYVFTPSVGYPTDVPHSSTVNYACWLGVYQVLRNGYTEDIEEYREYLHTFCVGSQCDFIAGIRVPETKATINEQRKIDLILNAMIQGTDFDQSFMVLYQRLLTGELIPPGEIITGLYSSIS